MKSLWKFVNDEIKYYQKELNKPYAYYNADDLEWLHRGEIEAYRHVIDHFEMVGSRMLADFIDEALNDKGTVEMSFYRMLTDDEIQWINESFERINAYVDCYPCETCEKYSLGEKPYHIERKWK